MVIKYHCVCIHILINSWIFFLFFVFSGIERNYKEICVFKLFIFRTCEFCVANDGWQVNSLIYLNIKFVSRKKKTLKARGKKVRERERERGGEYVTVE